jgi:hypothetical protein
MTAMMRCFLSQTLAVLLVAFAMLVQAGAADIATNRRVRGHVPPQRYVLPPERHVVDSVRPPYSGNYLINATRFTARTPACARWVSGEQIRLVAGDWHGACTSAVFYNVSRRMTCELSCG